MKWRGILLAAWVAACGGAEFSPGSELDASSPVGSGGQSGAGGKSVVAASATTSAGGANQGGANGGDGGAAGAGGTADAGSDARGGGTSADCNGPADCGGNACVELFPGGYRVCVVKVPEATTCSIPQGQCCSSAECGANGRCVAGPIDPSCGGPVVATTNACAVDACKSASDCSGNNAICVPAGALGRKAARCLTGGCRLDRDCHDEPGGICAPVTTSCCTQPVGLHCVYGDGCRSDADCKVGQHCTIDGGRLVCATGIMPCPVVP